MCIGARSVSQARFVQFELIAPDETRGHVRHAERRQRPRDIDPLAGGHAGHDSTRLMRADREVANLDDPIDRGVKRDGDNSIHAFECPHRVRRVKPGVVGTRMGVGNTYDAAMAMIRDECIAIHAVDYSETSQVVVLFTREHGKVRAIAKGIKRSTKTRVGIGIDLLDIGQVVLRARSQRSDALATITEWKQTRSLAGVRRALFRIYAGQYAAEITARCTEDWDPNAAVFEALLSLLFELEDATEPHTPLIAYQRALLTAIGSMPELRRCVVCNRTDAPTHFSALEGGTACARCGPSLTEKRAVSPATAEALHRDEAPVGVFRLLNYHIAYLIGREPRLAAKIVPPHTAQPS